VPSLYEGFGLPVLEAMARGQVVVAARTSSLPEVGGNAVLYVDDPGDAEAFASVLQRATADGEARASFARRAVKRAREFRWPRCWLPPSESRRLLSPSRRRWRSRSTALRGSAARCSPPTCARSSRQRCLAGR